MIRENSTLQMLENNFKCSVVRKLDICHWRVLWILYTSEKQWNFSKFLGPAVHSLNDTSNRAQYQEPIKLLMLSTKFDGGQSLGMAYFISHCLNTSSNICLLKLHFHSGSVLYVYVAIQP
jgi:hypothetical protein